MPLANVPGSVAGVLKPARHQRDVRFNLSTKVVDAVSETAGAGEDFGPTGGADRVATRRPCESASLCDETIEVWRFDPFVAQRVDRVRSLVIADDQQHVWPGGENGRGGDRHRYQYCKAQTRQCAGANHDSVSDEVSWDPGGNIQQES